MPKATETLSDSFWPYIGIKIILSALFKIAGGKPSTSLPMIRAIFSAPSVNLNLSQGIAFLFCSKAIILKPSFKFIHELQVWPNFSHGTNFSAPKETFSMLG